MARWSDVAGAAERGDRNLTSARVTVVGNSQSGERFPVTMPDGDEFYGIYPVCMKCRVEYEIMNKILLWNCISSVRLRESRTSQTWA